jgi:hypothetical protein
MYPERVNNDGQHPGNEFRALPAPGHAASNGAAPSLHFIPQFVRRRPFRAVLLAAAVFAIPYSLTRHGSIAPPHAGPAATAQASWEPAVGPIAIIPRGDPSRTSWDPPIGVDRTNESLDQLTLDFSSSESPGATDDSQAPASQLPGSSPGLQSGLPISSLPAEAAQPARTGTPGADGDYTAIYDIASRTVYLPDGHRLEAHSGLG